MSAGKFVMPAEYGPHEATVMIWPERPGSWIYGAEYARPVFRDIIRKICGKERVYLAVSGDSAASARGMLKDEIAAGRVFLTEIPTDDCWARDIAPLFVSDGRKIKGIDFAFNAWGGEYDGLYRHYGRDDAFARTFCERAGYMCESARPFVFEGGSVHSDGSGTVMVTEECLLSPGRNPALGKTEIEREIRRYLGADRVIWLPYGVEGDETDGHIDNICAFTGGGKAVLAWTDVGEQGMRCRRDLEVLEREGIETVKIPFPSEYVRVTSDELAGYSFEEGEDEREEGEILAASYVNFYVCNAGVLMPVFGDRNDGVAAEILGECFPEREIIPVPARQLILGGGNIHCLTMQIPAVYAGAEDKS